MDYHAAASAEEAASAADILTTATPATQAIVVKDWIRPGTHVNAMGADTRGRQELAEELVTASRVVVVDVAQATTIGECQHAFPRACCASGR